jgi:hypothetical protein
MAAVDVSDRDESLSIDALDERLDDVQGRIRFHRELLRGAEGNAAGPVRSAALARQQIKEALDRNATREIEQWVRGLGLASSTGPLPDAVRDACLAGLFAGKREEALAVVDRLEKAGHYPPAGGDPYVDRLKAELADLFAEQNRLLKHRGVKAVTKA